MLQGTTLDLVVHTYYKEVTNYIYGKFRCNMADARDIVQETVLRMLKYKSSNFEQVRAFMYTTAKNIAIDHIRKDKTSQGFTLAMQRHAELFLYFSPEQQLMGEQSYAILQDLIDHLPNKTRKALRCVREDGLSYEEVGVLLGIKTHSARRLVERAMEYLAKHKAELLS